MTEVRWFDMAHPADYGGLQALLGDMRGIEKVAVLVKTEGHTAANDFARQLSRSVLDPIIEPLTREGRAVAVLANGCEGMATPGGYAFIQRRVTRAAARSGLQIGMARSEPLPERVLGMPAMIDTVADCVRRSLGDAGMTAPEAALAIVKCPTMLASQALLEPFRADQHRGRALAALGVAVAMEEVPRGAIDDTRIGQGEPAHTLKAMTFAGPEERWVEVIVLGNWIGPRAVEHRPPASAGLGKSGDAADEGPGPASTVGRGAAAGAPDATTSSGIVRIGVCHPADMLDAGSIRRLLLSMGMRFDDAGELLHAERIVGIVSKAGPEPDGRLRGARTAIFGSAYSADSHMRAAQSGLLGGLFGTTRFFVSGDPVHQAPPGGGVVAILIEDPA